ncbi:MAG TPA: hypothetical protein VKN36_01565 [Eudoraea sp.]|nr:hypothetical protein [Eudoraea sp.]
MKVLASIYFPKIGIGSLRPAVPEFRVWTNDLPMQLDHTAEAIRKHDSLLSPGVHRLVHNLIKTNKHLKQIAQFEAENDHTDAKKAAEAAVLIAKVPGPLLNILSTAL